VPSLPPPPPPPPPRPKAPPARAQLPASTTIPSHPVEVTNAPPPPWAQEALASDWDKPMPLTDANVQPGAKARPPLPPPRMTIDVDRPADPSDFKPKQSTPPSAAAPLSSASPGVAPQVRSARDAARALLNYVSPLIRAGKAAQLGSKDAPNDTIANAQRDMRIIKSDGIYGPKTAARGKELLGIEFPSRVSNKRVAPQKLDAIDLIMKPPPVPPPPSQKVAAHSPLEAASALLVLVTNPPVNWGTRANPNKLIAAAQKDMGGGLKADGVYGPLTASRGAKLLGKPFPARE